MRASAIAIGLIVLFAVLARTVWLHGAATSVAYEVRQLREQEAEMRNHNDLIEVDVSRLRTGRSLEEAEARLALEDLDERKARSLEIAPHPTGDAAAQ